MFGKKEKKAVKEAEAVIKECYGRIKYDKEENMYKV